jgi:tRNA threonylcarbamoyl adenosine modification protein YjeE
MRGGEARPIPVHGEIEHRVTRHLPAPSDTEALGAELALVARPGSAILLEGDLGAGKTTLARALIHALALEAGDFDVPSPTFTLIQTHDALRFPVAHVDLYRITRGEEVTELGLDELAGTHLLLVEWPDRLDSIPTEDRLTVRLATEGKGRVATLVAEGGWRLGLARLEAIRRFLKTTRWAGVTRRFLEGDASFRRYERLGSNGEPTVLMDMPARPDGPPVKYNKPYSAIAHLAEDIRAVVAVNRYLHGLGYSAPAILDADIGNGLAVIEDLGDRVYGRMMLAGDDMREPQRAAVAVLADMAKREWPVSVTHADCGTHVVAPYDREAQIIETELLTDWFWPYRLGSAIPAQAKESFLAAWHAVLPQADPKKPVWTLRDYHSPNLLWLPERQGLARVGIIDTQDCVLGHAAYDLASLLQDARVTVEAETAAELLDHYCELRRPFDEAELRAAYAILGAQRATKILGIFARLFKRDGKPAYLAHMPRVSRYLERDLEHPALAPVKAWFDRHLPAAIREGAAG